MSALSPRRVGHKGADHIAPGNTAASFDAALDAGVDMIEFDVLSARPDGTGELFLAHDYAAMGGGHPPTLEEGLAHLAGDPFAEVELDVDLKLPGYELRVLDALRALDLLERTIVSSMFPASLALLRREEPALKLGWSVPRLQSDPTRHPVTAGPAYVALGIYRATLPHRAAAAVRGGRVDALMAQYRLVTPALVRQIHRVGGELYAWTVDDPGRIARLEALGVDGVITNDPRLFSPRAAS